MIYFHPNFDSVRVPVFRDAGRYLCQVSSADTSLDTYLTAAASITFATYRNLNLMSTVCAYQTVQTEHFNDTHLFPSCEYFSEPAGWYHGRN